MSAPHDQSRNRFFQPQAAPAAEAGDGSGAMLVYLGLFMLLLAFFILLNAISHFHDEKVGAVLRSVDQAFAVPGLLTGSSGDRPRDAALGDAVRAIDELGDMVRSDIAVARVEATGGGHVLTVTMPADTLFSGSGMDMRGDRVALMDRMAGALVPRRAGVTVEGELLLGTAGLTDTGPAVARAGALARALVANGAPASALSIGLEPGDPAGQVRLIFTVSGARAGGGEVAP